MWQSFIRLSSYFEEKIMDDHCSVCVIGVCRVTISRTEGINLFQALIF